MQEFDRNILEIWVRNVLEDLCEIDVDQKSIEECLILAARFIFSEDSLMNISDVVTLAGERLDFKSASDDANSLIYALIKVCLISAVSSECLNQSLFVHNILAMDSEHQSYLMEVIQNAQTVQSESQIVDISEEESSIKESIEEVVEQSPMIRFDAESALTNSNKDDSMCHNCIYLTDISNSLRREYEIIIQREKQIEVKCKAEIAEYMNKLVDAEVHVLQKDQKIRELSEQVESTSYRIKEYEDELKAVKDSSEALVTLQDRLDVLIPQAEKVEHLESQLARLRSKLDEAKNLKTQLKDESTAHSETHTQLLAAESELDVTRKYKPLLDEYRNKHAEALITIDTLTIRLQNEEQELLKLNQVLSSQSGSDGNASMQVHALSEELRATQEKLRCLERVGGVGEGMSELNPVVMNELRTLRTQNQELLSKLDQSSMESLQRLANDNDELRCVNSNLTAKWMTASDELTKARACIEQLQLLYSQSQQRVIELERLMDEFALMKGEELAALSTRYSDRITGIVTTAEQAYEEMEVKKNSSIERLQSLYDATSSELSAAQTSIETLTDDGIAKQQSIDELEEKIRCGHVQVKEMVGNYKRKISTLEQAHDDVIEQEAEKSRALVADIEVERAKRRRVEREKKLLEAEVQRNKAQVQVAGTSSVHEVEHALKEFKSMQSQLEEAQAEVQYLRSLTSSGEGSSTGVHTNLSSTEVAHGSKLGGASRMTGPKRSYKGENSLESGLLQHNEFSERKLEHLQKEKREMIARGLEENKEKMELSQKLLASERELTGLKSKLTKLTLDNERLQRRLANSTTATADSSVNKGEVITTSEIKENVEY